MKKLSMTAFVVLMILAFTVTTVGAQSKPPVVDPGSMEPGTPPELIAPESDVSVESAAVPVSPYFNNVYTLKPKFIFQRNYLATNYHIQIYSYESATIVADFYGAGSCTAYYCSLTSPMKLKYRTMFDPDSGYYDWRVQAYAGGWQDWSSVITFVVNSAGFNDSFLTNTIAIRWFNVEVGNFSWVKTDTKSILKAPGQANWWSTVVAKDKFNNVDYTVRMKRKANESSANAVIIWADLWPATSANELHDGIYFQYSNYPGNGQCYWGVWKMTDGAFSWVQPWILNSAIVPFGWNTLRVVGKYPYLDFWINDVYLGWYKLTTGPTNGVNGVSMIYVPTETMGPLSVDWAVAIPIQEGVYSTHDPSMELGLDPAPDGMVPWAPPMDANPPANGSPR